MADTKISALSAGTAAPGDEIPVNRGGSNFKITAGDILKINGGTITADSPVLNLTQTWNNAAVTFTGLKFNATDTTSASGSLLMDLQVGGASKFRFHKDGTLTLNSGATGSSIGNISNWTMFYNGGTGAGGYSVAIGSKNSGRINLPPAGSYEWGAAYASDTPDLRLFRDAADTLAQRNAANAQTFRIYNTADGSPGSNYERGKIAWESNVLKIGTEKAGIGTARALEFQTDGTTRLTISTGGSVIFSSDIKSGNFIRSSANHGFLVDTRAGFVSPTTENIQFRNAAADGFGLLQFGGTTSSFPALKRSSTTLIARLADDSANAAFESASLKTDAPTGGTAATWKLGTVASVTPTSPDRTIEVDIGGTIYYLHAKTTND